MSKLSVIIPVLNEAGTIRTVLNAVREVPVEKEIIVVDGNSTDGTREILEDEEVRGDLKILYQTQRNGRGGALQDGMKVATGDIIVFQDADLELDPGCFPDLMAPILQKEAEVVLGSRFLNGKPRMTPLQYIGNRVVTECTNLLWFTRLTDVETCYQMFRRETISGMKFDRKDMSFTVELTLRLIRSGKRIREVAVDYIPRTHDEGKKLYWGDGFISLYVLFRYRLLWWFSGDK